MLSRITITIYYEAHKMWCTPLGGQRLSVDARVACADLLCCSMLKASRFLLDTMSREPQTHFHVILEMSRACTSAGLLAQGTRRGGATGPGSQTSWAALSDHLTNSREPEGPALLLGNQSSGPGEVVTVLGHGNDQRCRR